jgi:hypothetical protein
MKNLSTSNNLLIDKMGDVAKLSFTLRKTDLPRRIQVVIYTS